MSKTAIEQIIIERQRQIDKYGYSNEHILKAVEDYSCGELADAAACYCLSIGFRDENIDYLFPWELSYFKPSPDDRIKELVKAGAMIVAEITRLQNEQ